MTIQSTVANCWELSNKNYSKLLQSASHNLLFLIYLPACFLPTYRTGHESNDQNVRVMRSSAPELLAQRWVRQGLHLVCVVSADSYL